MKLDHAKTGTAKIKNLNIDAVLSQEKELAVTAGVVGVSVNRSHRLVRLQYERGRARPIWID